MLFNATVCVIEQYSFRKNQEIKWVPTPQRKTLIRIYSDQGFNIVFGCANLLLTVFSQSFSFVLFQEDLTHPD